LHGGPCWRGPRRCCGRENDVTTRTPAPQFFGYGSLVNLATHAYPNAHEFEVAGWARTWTTTRSRPYAYLTATEKPGTVILGARADVPRGDWTALDAREAGYARLMLSDGVAIYSVLATDRVDAPAPILLSYLDVVIQGYLAMFGAAGAAHFFDTTQGWDRPILNDRPAPIYPRAQILSDAETSCVDQAITRLGCEIVRPAS
jgi:hypothetical protein